MKDLTHAVPTIRRRLAFYAIFVVLNAVLTVAALELVARLCDPLGVSYYVETAAYMDTLVLEEPIGYRNQPNLKGRFYGVPVVINSLGLRDRELSIAPDPDEYRVLVMGDSVVFGIGVPFEHSIPYQLERCLAVACSEWRMRTVNMGTVSYNTEQELIQLRTLGMRLKPKLVVLIYTANDVLPKMWIFEKRRAWPARLVQRSYGACLLAVLWKKITGLGPVGALDTERYGSMESLEQAVDRSLTEMNNICKSAAVPFVVFTFALEDDFVVRSGAREGFPVVNLLKHPYWSEAGVRPEDFQNSASDGHPNRAGSETYARLMCDALLRLGVVGCGSVGRP